MIASAANCEPHSCAETEKRSADFLVQPPEPLPENTSSTETHSSQPISRTLTNHGHVFTEGDRCFLRILLIVSLLFFAAEWIIVVTRKPDPLIIQRGEQFSASFRVHVNSATWIEWMQLDGIGPSLAHRIEADRRLNGPFRSVDDLRRVSGIGPVTLESIRPGLIFDEPLLPSVPE